MRQFLLSSDLMPASVSSKSRVRSLTSSLSPHILAAVWPAGRAVNKKTHVNKLYLNTLIMNVIAPLHT